MRGAAISAAVPTDKMSSFLPFFCLLDGFMVARLRAFPNMFPLLGDKKSGQRQVGGFGDLDVPV